MHAHGAIPGDEDALELKTSDVQAIFEPVVAGIVDITLRQLDQVGRRVPVAVLVGGLSESPYIQQMMRNRLASRVEHVICPPRASKAVMCGAVIYGLDTRVFSERCSRRTYAVEASRPCMPGDPADMRREQFGEYYTDFLRIWIKKGEVVPMDKAIEDYFMPAALGQTDLRYRVYVSDRTDVEFRAADTERIFAFQIKVPPNDPNLIIKVSVFFGDTVIKLVAVDTRNPDDVVLESEINFDRQYRRF